MEKGFLNSGMKNDVVRKDDSLLHDLASKIKKIDGKLLGKDGKPLKAYRRDLVSSLTTTDGISYKLSTDGVSNSKAKHVKLYSLVHENVIPVANITLLNESVDEITNKFANTLYGHFIGCKHAFPILNRYVKNTWARYGLERTMFHHGFFFFQFSSKTGRPIMLDAHTAYMCVNSWGWCSYALALIEVDAKKALADSIVVAVPIIGEKGHSLETISIEYEWKPPRCRSVKFLTTWMWNVLRN
nr:zinc knuckle CX2CX4HX4C [Tanacetum cinerariifolium]